MPAVMSIGWSDAAQHAEAGSACPVLVQPVMLHGTSAGLVHPLAGHQLGSLNLPAASMLSKCCWLQGNTEPIFKGLRVRMSLVTGVSTGCKVCAPHSAGQARAAQSTPRVACSVLHGSCSWHAGADAGHLQVNSVSKAPAYSGQCVELSRAQAVLAHGGMILGALS